MTTCTAQQPGPTVEELAVDFDLSLAVENRSPATRRVYGAAVSQFAAFLAERGMPSQAASVRREHVEAFVLDVLERRSASTARTRFDGLRRFFRFLEDEGEVAASPMARMKPRRSRSGWSRSSMTTPSVAC